MGTWDCQEKSYAAVNRWYQGVLSKTEGRNGDIYERNHICVNISSTDEFAWSISNVSQKKKTTVAV